MVSDSPFISEKFSKGSSGNKHLILMKIAAWLIDNTSLTFNQIAQSCGLNLEEVQDIADEEITVEKYNPVAFGIMTENDINYCQNNANQVPKFIANNIKMRSKAISNTFGATSAARRRDKPDAIYYLIKKFPILDNNVIAKLVSTTNQTVEQIRNSSHHNMQNIKPQDPVLLGLCSQKNLEAEVEKAEIEKEKQERLKNIKNNY